MKDANEQFSSTLHVQPAASLAVKAREPHLQQLAEPQELYLELLAREGNPYLIKQANRQLGYLIAVGGKLVEFYLDDTRLPYLETILKTVVTTLRLEKAVCQSFDAVLLRAGLTMSSNIVPIGHLFRERISAPVKKFQLQRQLANEADVAWVRDVNEEIFESLPDIETTIGNRNVFIYSQAGKRIGFGIFQRTLANRNGFDIGMLVLPEYRRREFGTAIISDLAEHCRVNGYRPTCGCDINNLASKRALERAGFISKHLMLEIEF